MADDVRNIELKLTLSATGDVKLAQAQQEIRLIVEAADKATGSLSALSLAIQRNLVGLQDHITKIGSALGLSIQRNLEQTIGGLRGFKKSTDESTTSMFAAVTAANLLSTAITRVIDYGANRFREAYGTGARFIRGVTNEFEDQTKQIIRASEAYERFNISIENAVRSQDRARLIGRLAFSAGAASPFGVGDFERATQQLLRVPAIRAQAFGEEEQATKRLDTIYDTITRLASLNPDQGVPGAVFAFRLALQGQFRALTRQYNISVGEVVEATGRSAKELKQNGALLAEGLASVLKERVTDEAITRLGRLPSAKISNLKEYVESIIPRQIGQAGFREAVQDVLGLLDETFLKFVEPGGDFERRFAPALSNALTRILGAVVKGGGAALGVALDFSPGEDPLSAFFLAVQRFAEKAASTVEKIASTLTSERGQTLLTAFFDSMFGAIERFVDGIFSLFSKIPDLLPFIGQTFQVVSYTVQGISTIIDKLEGFIDGFIDDLVEKVPGFRVGAIGQAATRNRLQRNVNAELAAQFAEIPARGPGLGSGGTNAIADFAAQDAAARLGKIFSTDVVVGYPTFSEADKARTAPEYTALRKTAATVLKDVRSTLIAAAAEEARTSDGSVDPKRFAEVLHSGFSLFGARFDQSVRGSLGGDTATTPFGRFAVGPGTSFLASLLESTGLPSTSFAQINPASFVRTVGGTDNREALGKLADLAAKLSQPGSSSEVSKNAGALRSLFEAAQAGGVAGRGRSSSGIAEALGFGLEGFRAAGADTRTSASLAREQLETSFFTPTERAAKAAERLELQRAVVAAQIEEDYRQALGKIVGSVVSGGIKNFPEALKAVGTLGVGRKGALAGLEADLSALNLAALSGGLSALLQIDPRDIDALEAASEEIWKLAKNVSAITLDDGSRALLGAGGVRSRVSAIFDRAGGEFRRQGAGFGAFGGGIDSQIAAQESLLRSYREEEGYLGRMLDTLRELNLTAEERSVLEKQIAAETSKQTTEIERSLEVLSRKRRIQQEDRDFEDRFFNESRPGFESETRFGLLGERLSGVRASVAGLTELLDQQTKLEAVGGSVFDPEQHARYVSLLDDEKERLRALEVEYRNLGRSIAEADQQRAEQRFLDRTTAGRVGSALDVFERDERTGRLTGVKSAERNAEIAGQNVAVSFATGFQSGIGDSIYGALTGDFDSIAQAWRSFTSSLTRSVADQFAGVVTKGLFTALGIFSGAPAAAAPAAAPAAIGGIEGWSSGNLAARPKIVMVGEGGVPEWVIPSPGGVLPLVMTGHGPAAYLPGGRLAPTRFIEGYAEGGAPVGGSYLPGSSSFSRISPSALRGETVVNVAVVANPTEITRQGLAGNVDAVVSIGAADLRNQGRMYRAAVKPR